MKRSTKRIFLPAHLAAAIIVGIFAHWLNTKFPAMNWSSPWLWGFLAFLYLFIAGPFVLGATIHETARYVTDTGRNAAPPPPPQFSLPPSNAPRREDSPRRVDGSPRRPMPKVLKIVGIGVGALLASFVVLFVNLMVYFIFNPTPEMLAKTETRRIDAEIQRIETEQHLKAAQQRLEAAKTALTR